MVVGLANHTVLIARDGTEPAVDDSAAPIRHGSGATIGAVLVFRDITERAHRTEAERERLLQEVEAERKAPSGWPWTRGRRASGTGTSPRGESPGPIGLPSSTACGRRSSTAPWTCSLATCTQRTPTASWRPIRASVEEDAPYLIECRIVQKGGAVRWIYTAATVIRDVAGRPVRMIGATTDVTDRKRAEQELRETDRRKDEFLALLAHELRNPLAPLRNGLQVIRMAGGNLNAVAKARAMMERQLGHMVRLIDDLLDVSRIRRHKMELRRDRVALAMSSTTPSRWPAPSSRRPDIRSASRSRPSPCSSTPTSPGLRRSFRTSLRTAPSTPDARPYLAHRRAAR